jgi:hypothetical protein
MFSRKKNKNTKAYMSLFQKSKKFLLKIKTDRIKQKYIN